MKQQQNMDSSFEEYRRDRNFRRLQHSGPLRPMGKNATILQQLEEAEKSEIQDERLAREVHEFFADATRTAANIVQQIAGSQEQQTTQLLRSEIEDFLADVLRRAESFMTAFLATRRGGGVQQELEPHVHNLVGYQLDQFRHEGTARLDDKHIGQDPFKEPLPARKSEATPPAETNESMASQAAKLNWNKPSDAAPAGEARTPAPSEATQGEAKHAETKQPQGKDAKGKRGKANASPASQPKAGTPGAQKQTPEQLQKAIDALVASGVIGAEQAKTLLDVLPQPGQKK